MAIPTKDEAQDILGPYHGLVWRIIQDSWNEWRTVHASRIKLGMGPIQYHRTISNYVFDAIARRAIPAFLAEPRVNVEVEAQSFKLFFRGLLLARFKKGGDDKLGRSIPTLTAIAFMDADRVFPGMPPETAKVEFIWLPNDIWTKVEQVLVIARDGDQLIWEYEIENPAEKAELITFLVPHDDQSESDDEKLIKPRKQSDTKPASE